MEVARWAASERGRHETALHFVARQALAALDEAGLLDQFREGG
ncbi:hypothetical protein [Streptomyces sp. AC555_RSS877]|nr:hypothetical protein [Streptomyces sp. AC555_RSS877]